jgi:4-hydroxy-4-methyl-2-oxoglutarate aldolase
MRKMSIVTGAAIVFLSLSVSLRAQQGQVQGKSMVPFKTYTAEEDKKVLELFDGLRVADVSDGLDMAGLPDVGLMNQEMRPLWRDTEKFAHRFCGIAVTVRYVPTNKVPGKMSADEFRKWEGEWYNQISPEPFVEFLRDGSAVVIDGEADRDTGSIGSNNILGWKLRGMRGVITSGGVRDTDEIILEKIPVYHKRFGRGIRPGRNEVESVNQPVMCGGVLVRPGDVIVADGDGVVVVPRESAEAVAKAAHQILEGDKLGRRGLYEKLGIPFDETVEPGKPK